MSDVDYSLLVEDWARDQAKCSKCGRPREECEDPERLWYPQRHVCRADMETAAANWLYEQRNEDRPFHDGTFKVWAKNRSTHFPYRYDDGVTVWASPVDLDPDDDFLSSGEAVDDDGSAP